MPELAVTIYVQGCDDADSVMTEFDNGEMQEFDQLTCGEYRAYQARQTVGSSGATGAIDETRNRTAWIGRLNGEDIKVGLEEDWDDLTRITWKATGQGICALRTEVFDTPQEALDFMTQLASDLASGKVKLEAVKTEKIKRLKALKKHCNFQVEEQRKRPEAR